MDKYISDEVIKLNDAYRDRDTDPHRFGNELQKIMNENPAKLLDVVNAMRIADVADEQLPEVDIELRTTKQSTVLREISIFSKDEFGVRRGDEEHYEIYLPHGEIVEAPQR
jgi:hypothetical protein